MSNLNHLLFTTKKMGSNSLYWYSQKALNPRLPFSLLPGEMRHVRAVFNTNDY